MAYVIIRPHSNSNPTDQYRVVDASEWTAYVNGAKKAMSFAGSFDNHDDAKKRRDELNGYAGS